MTIKVVPVNERVCANCDFCDMKEYGCTNKDSIFRGPFTMTDISELNKQGCLLFSPNVCDEQYYDCLVDVEAHRELVGALLSQIAKGLLVRADLHDKSKFSPEEKPCFDKYIPRLKKCIYGSPEYKQNLEEMASALEHHYRENRHHPEYFQNGIDGMHLVDIAEMLCDWVASSGLRSSVERGIDLNMARFNLSPQLANIFKNTYWHLFVDVPEISRKRMSKSDKEK